MVQVAGASVFVAVHRAAGAAVELRQAGDRPPARRRITYAISRPECRRPVIRARLHRFFTHRCSALRFTGGWVRFGTRAGG